MELGPRHLPHIRLQPFWRWLISALIGVIGQGCISVKLGGPSQPERATVRVQAPPAPFAEIRSQWSDRAWKSKESGSVISYLSDCQPGADLPLESLRDDVLIALKRSQRLKESTLTFEGREALRSCYQGEVDGVQTAVDLLAFKKNGCSYTITLVAVPSFLDRDQKIFDQFLKGFRVP